MMRSFKKITFSKLSDEPLLRLAKTLDATGVIHQEDDYCYLKVNDAYILMLHPLLSKYGAISKPPYFEPPNDIGAHVSVIYPEEQVTVWHENQGQQHRFTVCGLVKAQYGAKEYFVLSVRAPSLAAFRERLELCSRPIFKGQEIVFHITIGIRAFCSL